MPNINLIGIDCAAQPKNVGLALGQIDGEVVRIQEVIGGKNIEKAGFGLNQKKKKRPRLNWRYRHFEAPTRIDLA